MTSLGSCQACRRQATQTMPLRQISEARKHRCLLMEFGY